MKTLKEAMLAAINNVNIDSATGCHNYRGDIDPSTEYGRIMIDNERYLVHRLSAHIHHGLDLLNSDAFVCHKCDNRKCCNPDHIYIGTNKQNQLDVVRDLCKKGHALTGSNVQWRRRANGAYYRNCRFCTITRNKAKNRKER